MHVRKVFEKEDFETALLHEPRHSISPDADVRRRFSYASGRFYAAQIRKARSRFPESQLLFLRAEDMKTAPGAMPEGPRARLRDLYAADVREVEALPGWDCGDWLA